MQQQLLFHFLSSSSSSVVALLILLCVVGDQQQPIHAFSTSRIGGRHRLKQYNMIINTNERIMTTTTTTRLDSTSTSSSNNQRGTTTTTTTTTKNIDIVDRNRYNLPIEQIAEEWTAVVVPESSLREAGIYLGAKSSDTIMVDTIPIVLTRQRGKGLGLELLEIAGGRSDGLGIVVVDGIVDGGIADGSNIMVGDSIAAVTVVKKVTTRQENDDTGDDDDGTNGRRTLSEWEDRQSIECECFGYDKLVDAIMSLPPVESDGEKIILTMKRLRRKPKVTIRLQYPPSQNEPDQTLELFAGENLRRAMLTRGVKLNDPLSRRFDSGGMGDCGAEGTCATCVVNIVEGGKLLNPQKIQEEQILAKNPRWRLACRAIVGYGDQEGSMTIRVNPRQWDDYERSKKTSLL